MGGLAVWTFLNRALTERQLSQGLFYVIRQFAGRHQLSEYRSLRKIEYDGPFFPEQNSIGTIAILF